MAKGLIKIMRELNSSGLTVPGYMLALLSMSVNLTLNFNQAADVLNSPWLREISEKMACQYDEIKEHHPSFFQ